MKFLDGIPFCPLCEKKMQTVKTFQGVFFTCIRRGCMVSCRTDDPCIQTWDDDDYKIDCNLCGKPMNTFIRQDGYAKAICKCGFKLEAIDEE